MYLTTETKVSIIGAKASVIRMLNTAIKNVGKGKCIDPKESLETNNNRFHFKDETGRERWSPFLIHDFLDMESIDNLAMKQRQKEFLDKCKDDCVPDGDSAVVVLNIIDRGADYEVELYIWEDSNNYYYDWATWADLAEVYSVKICEDYYEYMSCSHFYGTRIYEPVGGSVKMTEIQPRIKTDSFYEEFNKLIEIYPQRYKAVKIEALGFEIERLQQELADIKLSLQKENEEPVDMEELENASSLPEDVDLPF